MRTRDALAVGSTLRAVAPAWHLVDEGLGFMGTVATCISKLVLVSHCSPMFRQVAAAKLKLISHKANDRRFWSGFNPKP